MLHSCWLNALASVICNRNMTVQIVRLGLLTSSILVTQATKQRHHSKTCQAELGKVCDQDKELREHLAGSGAGIDHTIKVWEPTAAARRRPGAEAACCMERNKARQGQPSGSIVLSPLVLARLMGLPTPR